MKKMNNLYFNSNDSNAYRILDNKFKNIMKKFRRLHRYNQPLSPNLDKMHKVKKDFYDALKKNICITTKRTDNESKENLNEYVRLYLNETISIYGDVKKDVASVMASAVIRENDLNNDNKIIQFLNRKIHGRKGYLTIEMPRRIDGPRKYVYYIDGKNKRIRVCLIIRENGLKEIRKTFIYQNNKIKKKVYLQKPEGKVSIETEEYQLQNHELVLVEGLYEDYSSQGKLTHKYRIQPDEEGKLKYSVFENITNTLDTSDEER